MNKKLFVSIAIILLLIVGFSTSIKLWQNNQPPVAPTNQELLDVIVRDRPALLYKKQPVIQVTDIKNPAEGWYIVAIASVRAEKNITPAQVVILDREGSMKVVLGPEVDFPDYVTDTVTLPDSVIMELRKQ